MSDLFIIILTFVVISVLTFIMYLFLRKTIININQQSKDYFVDKLHAFDDLISQREDVLKDLNKKIEEKQKQLLESNKLDKKEESVYLYDEKNINYQDTDILKKFKLIDKKFNLNTTNLIKKFVNVKFSYDNVEKYYKYIEIRKKFSQNFIYSLISKSSNEQENKIRELLGELVVLLDDFKKKNKKFSIIKFVSYFDKIIILNDPYIYVYVGNSNENYDYINKFIKTKLDENIIKGVSIIYKGKLYDYSLK